jgi:hypothetical protein
MAENKPEQPKRKRGPGRPFAKGQSGNPGGRPKVALDIREKAKGDVEAAYATVHALMTGADKDSVRLSAAVRILQVAGVPMGEDKITVQIGSAEAAGGSATPSDLMEGLGPSEPLN